MDGGSRRTQKPWRADRPVSISPDHRRALQEASRFQEIRTTARLSPSVVALFADHRGKVAEPGQKWNGTCVMDPDLACQRLIWAASNGDYYVVHYERGGFIATSHVLIATWKERDASPQVVWRGTGWGLKNYEDFLDALQTYRLEDDPDYAP